MPSAAPDSLFFSTLSPLLSLSLFPSFCSFLDCTISRPLHGLTSPQGRSDQQDSHLTHQQLIHFVDPLTDRTLQLSTAGLGWKPGCSGSLPALRTASHGPSAVLSVQLMCTERQPESGTLKRLFWIGILTTLDFSQ